MPQSINNINYQRNPLHLSGNLHKGDKFASTPTSSLSESESLLQLKQKIQKHPAPGDGARRLEQLVKQPFCATFRKTASSEANRINGAESSHKSELPEVHKECFNQFEAMKVKMEKMEEQLHMVQRQNNKNTENLDVCQKQAASINLNKYKKINYDEQHTFFQNSICKCKSNNCTTFQMSFGRSSTSVLKQNDKIEKRFQRIEEQLNVERRAREDMYTQHSERFDKFDAKMEKMESNIDAKMEKMESNIDAKMEKMESNIDAKMEKMESNIDAKMEKMESNIDAKMEKMSLSIDAKFEKLSNIIIQMNNNEKKISDDYTLR
uniref:TACC_C domain-containing protein n=1 Tax=Meloidogyne hapla TaxID=6305 RepID=A0A1I8BZI7_MELHA